MSEVKSLPPDQTPALTQAEVEKLLETKFEATYKKFEDQVKTEGENIKKDFLTFFGLFASFMAFLSIEIQLFKVRDDWRELLGVTSISFSFIVLFALVLNDVAIRKDNTSEEEAKKNGKVNSTKWTTRGWMYLFTLLFAGLGTLLLFQGGKVSSAKAIENFEKKIVADSSHISLKLLKIDSLTKSYNTLEIRVNELEQAGRQLNKDAIMLNEHLNKNQKVTNYIRESIK